MPETKGHNEVLTRTFKKNDESYDLLVSEPQQADSGEFWTKVTLERDSDIVWSHQIAGIDGVQSTLLALGLARKLLESDGGFTFLDDADLMLPDF
ncbi:hypothetical protein OZX72_02780 [Bifidobacterium sp. ESL0769]|uniref:hypothetical protein n=1 Tax=Bifidobacterium sp. ESL0769 TaxID=2983229 RepID=UPI0023F73D85|nr:hypothetical protein [Bifidobacterium sp. ESL0769]WEV67926.1 hypothetical protein OZX72_02780 [Bifidobacterium sp. ESL0769]